MVTNQPLSLATAKVGDRVRCIDPGGNQNLDIGDEGVITRNPHRPGGTFITIKLDRSDDARNFYPYRFTLTRPRPATSRTAVVL